MGKSIFLLKKADPPVFDAVFWLYFLAVSKVSIHQWKEEGLGFQNEPINWTKC